MSQNYGAVPASELVKHEEHHEEREGGAHAHAHAHHRDSDPKGYPNEHSVWSGLPLWVLLVVQYLVGLGIAGTVAGAVSFFWIVAAVYYYRISEGLKLIQHLLAIVGFVLALVVSFIVYPILSLVALIIWVIWVILDIKAVCGRAERPKIISPYFLGLFTFAN